MGEPVSSTIAWEVIGEAMAAEFATAAFAETAGLAALGEGIGFVGEAGAALTDAGIGAGLGDFATGYAMDLGIDPTGLGADFMNELTSQASLADLTPTEYASTLEGIPDVPTSTMQMGETLTPEVQGYQTENFVDPVGSDTAGYDYGQTQGLDSAPKATMEQADYPFDTGEASYNQGYTTNGSGVQPGMKQSMTLKDIAKSPQFQIGKTMLDLYGQQQGVAGQRAGLNRLNELADRGQWANNMAQSTYANPQQYFDSPTYKNLASMYQNQYQRQQAAAGRRSDKAGLALAMQKFGADQFNNYTAGLSRFNQQPQTSGLAAMYGNVGNSNKAMLTTLANSELWTSMGY